MHNWISVKDSLPTYNVLAVYKNRAGKHRIVKAFYAAQYAVASDSNEFDFDYHEDTDMYYIQEGWYEVIENWEDHNNVKIHEGDITHWMPLPEPPREELK